MIIPCPKCQSEMKLNLPKLPASGISIRCKNCGHSFQHSPGANPAPPPASAPPTNSEPQPSSSAMDGLASFMEEFDHLTEETTASPESAKNTPMDDPLAGFVAEMEQITETTNVEPVESDTRYHIRRASGKVFGPFDVPAIYRMLDAQQLEGSEDLSPDNDFWSPMVDWPEFRERLLATTSQKNETPIPSSVQPIGAISGPTVVDHEEWQMDAASVPLSEVPSEEAAAARLQRRNQGRVRSALRDDVLHPNNDQTKKKPPQKNVALFGGLLFLLLLIGCAAYYFFMSDGSENPGRTVHLSTNQQQAFRLDGYRSYMQGVLPKFQRQARANNSNAQAQILYGTALAMMLENYGPAPAKGRELTSITNGLPTGTEEKPITLEQKRFHALQALSRKRSSEAIRWARQLPKNSKYGNDSLYIRGKVYYLQRRYKLAVKQFAQLLEKSPQHARAMYGKGISHKKLAQWDQAFQALYQTTLASKGHLLAYLALFEMESRLPEQARRYKALWQIADKVFQQANHHKYRSKLYQLKMRKAYAAGDLKATIDYLKQAIKFDRSNRKLKRLLPRYLFELRDYTRALNAYQAKLAKNKKDKTSTIYMLRILYRQRNFGLFRDWERDNAKRFKKSAALWYQRGRFQEAQQQDNLAVKSYQQSLELSKNLYLPALIGQAHLSWKRNRPTISKKLWKQALALEASEFPPAQPKTAPKSPPTSPKPAPKATKAAKAPGTKAAKSTKAPGVKATKTTKALGVKAAKNTQQAKKAAKPKPKRRKKRAKKQFEDFDLTLRKARYLLLRKDNEKAIALLLALHKKYPSDELVNRLLGDSYVTQNDLTNARKYYLKTIQILPKEQGALLGLAKSYEEAQEYDKAISFYEKYAAENPRAPKVFVNLGRLFFLKKNYDVAKKHLLRAERLDDRIHAIHFYLAQIGEQQKEEPAHVFKRYNQALEGKTPNPTYLFAYASYLYRQKKVKKALKMYTNYLKTAKQSPKNKANAYTNRGRLYIEMQNWRAAIRDLQQAQRIQRDHPIAAYYLAETYKEARKFSLALRWYTNYLRQLSKAGSSASKLPNKAKRMARVHTAMASIYRDRNKSSQAIRSYQKAVRLDPTLFENYRTLGYLYKDRRRWKLCARYLKLYLKKAPANQSDRNDVDNDLHDCRNPQ